MKQFKMVKQAAFWPLRKIIDKWRALSTAPHTTDL